MNSGDHISFEMVACEGNVLQIHQRRKSRHQTFRAKTAGSGHESRMTSNLEEAVSEKNSRWPVEQRDWTLRLSKNP